jgi:DNA polymerase-1
MACSDPNLQNIPRGREYRACFRAQPGWVLVKADYSAIELRLAAVIARDGGMLQAFQDGQDLHRQTAALVLGVPEVEVTKEQRQLAKALNFGLLYGMGAQTLIQHTASGYEVTLSLEEAEQHRRRFFASYPGLARWHRGIPREPIDTRTLAGRRRLGVEHFTEKVNSPVQGSGADGLKAALGRLWRHRHEVPVDVRLVATVHDEIVAECRVEDAPEVAAWLTQHMQEAMSEIVASRVPIEVEATIAQDWAGTPPERRLR